MKEENPREDDVYAKEWSVDTSLQLNEDCLYLNIWTPAKKTDEKLPVYFWIFGGGWQVGHASEMEFDGERIARPVPLTIADTSFVSFVCRSTTA